MRDGSDRVRRDVGGWISGPCLDAGDDDDLHATYGGRWQLGRALGLWTAERRDGNAVRYVVATSPAELAGKLAEIEGES